mgnify:CR=1 FL=1|tara:strand:- start:2499 stop:2903 length:405 start_codon:yes stop_codon:yes gene_type:complete
MIRVRVSLLFLVALFTTVILLFSSTAALAQGMPITESELRSAILFGMPKSEVEEILSPVSEIVSFTEQLPSPLILGGAQPDSQAIGSIVANIANGRMRWWLPNLFGTKMQVWVVLAPDETVSQIGFKYIRRWLP